MFRLHQLAGLLVAPLVAVLVLTGMGYALAPSIGRVLYHQELTATSDLPARPVSEQVEAAVQQHPDLKVAAVRISDDPSDTTRVSFLDPTLGERQKRSVYLDPGSLEIKGEQVTTGGSGQLPVYAWLLDGHRRLWLGDPGRIYAEVASSWLMFLALGGIYLWWDRRRRKRGARAAKQERPRRESARGRQMRKHTNLGLWGTAGVLFLGITGLTMTLVAGENIDALRKTEGWVAPKVSTKLPKELAAKAEQAAESGKGKGGQGSSTAPYAQADTVYSTAREYGLTRKVDLTWPKEAGKAWTAAESRQEFRLHRDQLAVDGRTGTITHTVPFSSYPLVAKLVDWGIDIHMGTLFGLPNQLVLVAVAIALLFIVYCGYRMWFLRNKRVIPSSGWREMHPGVLVWGVLGLIAYSVIAPLFGASLVALLLLDAVLRAIHKARGGKCAGEGRVGERRRRNRASGDRIGSEALNLDEGEAAPAAV